MSLLQAEVAYLAVPSGVKLLARSLGIPCGVCSAF